MTDAGGVPVSGVAVAFAVTAGGGSITGANATTNGSGVASVGSWTGPDRGSQHPLGDGHRYHGRSASRPPEPPTSLPRLAKVSGDNQSDSLNKALTNPLVVLVSDQFGNPVSGVTVTWAPSDGNLSATTSNHQHQRAGLDQLDAGRGPGQSDRDGDRFRPHACRVHGDDSLPRASDSDLAGRAFLASGSGLPRR